MDRAMTGMPTDRDDMVILLEGRRAVPPGMGARLDRMGQWLAQSRPEAVFRSGNAAGSDTAFATGVTSEAPARIQYVVTTPGMRRKYRHPGGQCHALTDVAQAELQALCDATTAATGANRRLVDAARDPFARSRMANIGRYLVRDTLKVLGSPSMGLAPAGLGLFYVDPADPEAGGTGHTIRVCRDHGVPVVFQDAFLTWMQG